MFIVDGKTITLEYSRDKNLGISQKYKHEERIEWEPRIVKSDWICGHCNGQNFAKRNECYRCSQPKSENSLLVNPSGEPLVDTIMTTDTPGTFLVAQGFNPLMSEDDIANIFRQFAVVKSCVLIMDYSKQMSRGIAYIEFHTVEYAAFCIDGVKKVGLKVEDGRDIKLNYASIIYMNKLLTAQQQQYQQLMNPMAIAALQAAQWSSSNTFLQQQQQVEAYNTALYNATMKPKSVWPPVFETNGGAYVFQAQSGSFFEQISGFYYFPKTKLYYNSSTTEYFVHSPGNDPPFAKYDASTVGTVQVNNTDTSTNNIEGNTSSVVNNNVNVAELMKKPVIISLGAANKKNSTASSKKVLVNQWAGDNDDDDDDSNNKMNSNIPLPPVVKSKYAKAGPMINTPDTSTTTATIDLSKYGPPVQSDKNNGNVGNGNRSRSDSNVDNSMEVVSGTQTGNTATVNITANTNGKFICHLCKRQFNSAQHLAQHEQGSQLHKDNLMKKQAEENGPVYRDRAAERRNTFGSSDPAVTLRYYNDNNDEASSGDKKRRKEDHTPATTSVPVSLMDDNANMGNQLLRKMGWNDGKGLGKAENGMSETVAEIMSQNNRNGTNKTVGIGTSVGPSIDYDGSDERYAQSLRVAAKFRYDQINDKK